MNDTGILITNLGTPEAPTPSAIRGYLRQFLSDPRVVEIPRAIWLPILYTFILPLRPFRTAKLYEKIWTPSGSPLRVISEKQAVGLSELLRLPVALGMRYGTPSIKSALESLRDKSRIIVLPLYPQYCGATTGSTFDAIAKVLSTWRNVPELHFINHYFDDPAYIQALADSIRTHRKGQKLLFSFHGIPQRSVDLGDPYVDQCHSTARLVAANLGLAQDAWQIVFQSRFGRAEWVKPYFVEVMKSLAGTTVDVICPGFAADCLETLEEIALHSLNINYIPALNDSPAHLHALAKLLNI
jgi:protoporphyrin/coproporphyrin ferrochelatase